MKIKAWRTSEGYTPASAGFHFWCPGCEEPHSVKTEGAGAWTFNGDTVKPTVSPSVLVRWFEHPTDTQRETKRCHSYVKDGFVQFLDDCHHTLKGCTIPIPDWPWE